MIPQVVRYLAELIRGLIEAATAWGEDRYRIEVVLDPHRNIFSDMASHKRSSSRA
ncbi:hypothetical protein MGAST_13700 [Mycobacterium gastri 'Wayne']|nr:hypothetical protein MGAST_13700 [Mycobacterium gastri 'Wayne']